jgi:hypothetical protein
MSNATVAPSSGSASNGVPSLPATNLPVNITNGSLIITGAVNYKVSGDFTFVALRLNIDPQGVAVASGTFSLGVSLSPYQQKGGGILSEFVSSGTNTADRKLNVLATGGMNIEVFSTDLASFIVFKTFIIANVIGWYQ